MDNAGWYARYQANKDAERWNSPQRGPDGRYQPVEQIFPMDGSVGGFNVPLPQAFEGAPPTPPPKDNIGLPGSDYQPQAVSPTSSLSQATLKESAGRESLSYSAHQLTHMTAVERSQSLRVARMDPYLQLMAGPLLRYDTVDERGIWRGAAMIVTADAGSNYDPNPRLTYSWDPDRPVKLPRANSRQYQRGQSVDLGPHPADPLSLPRPTANGEYHGPNEVQKHVRGQEIWVYVGNGGTCTFWRFMIEIPLDPYEMRIKYSVNNGQELEFYVPGRNQNMRWAAYSCNGFSAGVNPNDFCGPGFHNGYDPVWSDLLVKHHEKPFHALVGGGDQLYCDGIVREPEMQEWVTQLKPEKKKVFQMTDEMRIAIDRFFFNHYCHHFRSGAFARANSSIPMLNMLDDHDLIDGFGSYPDDLMSSPVFGTIGSRGYFFFLLFQCFVNVEIDGRDDRRHPFKSLIIGGDGPLICYCSIVERKKNQVCSQTEYRAVFDRVYMLPRNVEHLVIQLGIPIAYPRMVFLENVLESKMNPLVTLGRNGSLGLASFVNKFNADAELLDDLNDHWTAKAHKRERNWFIEQLQAYAKNTHTRVTFLSGDVHCAAVGVLKTLQKGKQEAIPPALDHRYMLNIVSSQSYKGNPSRILTDNHTL